MQVSRVFETPSFHNLLIPHPKPHLTCNIPVNPDVYPSGINVPEHFTVVIYSKGKELPQEDVFATFWRSLESII